MSINTFKIIFIICFIFTKVALQGKVSYLSMPIDVLEGSENLKSEIVACIYYWIFLKFVALFSYIKAYFPFSSLRKT